MRDVLAPLFLGLFAVLPVLVVARWWLLRKRRPTGLRYSSLSLIQAASPGSNRVRRHLPFGFFLLGAASLVLAMARPVDIVSVPAGQTTVILAMDVSRSMCATDIQPNRLVAAENAAAEFITRQGGTTQIGIVAFAGFAEMVQAPTTDQEVLLDVIESLATGRRTAIGSAILESLDAIAEVDPGVAKSDPAGASPGVGALPVPKGAYAPAIIVLLTDGASNAGPLPVEAAQQAAARGIRVYTIGFGTANPGGELPFCDNRYVGREPAASGDGGGFFGGVGGGGGSGSGPGAFRRAIDEETLKAVAEATGGKYYPAESSNELQAVFQSLPTTLITKHVVMELSVVFAALGLACVAAAIFLGQRWRPLP